MYVYMHMALPCTAASVYHCVQTVSQFTNTSLGALGVLVLGEVFSEYNISYFFDNQSFQLIDYS